jgi:hypothetical protein
MHHAFQKLPSMAMILSWVPSRLFAWTKIWYKNLVRCGLLNLIGNDRWVIISPEWFLIEVFVQVLNHHCPGTPFLTTLRLILAHQKSWIRRQRPNQRSPITHLCACSCDNMGTRWTRLSSELTHTVNTSQIAGLQTPIAALNFNFWHL